MTTPDLFLLAATNLVEFARAIVAAARATFGGECFHTFPVFEPTDPGPVTEEFYKLLGTQRLSPEEWCLKSSPPTGTLSLADDHPVRLAVAVYLASLLGWDLIVGSPFHCPGSELEEWLRQPTDVPTAVKAHVALSRLCGTDGSSLADSSLSVALADEYALVGALHALRAGKPFLVLEDLRQLEELVEHVQPRSLALCGQPQWFHASALRDLFRILGSRHGGNVPLRIPFGLLTARNLPSLSRLLIRMHYHPDSGSQATRIILPTLQESLSHFDDTHVEYYTQTNLSQEALARLQREPCHTLILSTHGQDVDAYLFHGALCGKPEEAKWDGQNPDDDGRLPICAFGPGCRIPATADILPAHTIRCHTFYLKTCGGLKLTPGIFRQDFNLGLRILDGWPAALVATPRYYWGSNSFVLLFRALTAGGYALGEAVRLMNNALWGMGSDFPTYLLVGDPDSRNCQPDAGRYTVESEVRGNGSLWLRFRNVEAELIEVQLSDPDLCRRIRRTGCRLELEREAQQPLTFLIAAEPGDITLRLLVFGYGRLHHSSLTMTLHSGGLLTPAECARLGRLARNLGQAPWFGVSLDDNVKELEAAMQRLARTERVLRGQVGHASSSTLARSLKAQARDAQARLLARLLREATQRPFWLPHEYAVAFQGQNLNDSTGDCPLCGERVYEKILAHPFETESIRHIGQCPRCGLVYDRPQGHGLLVFGGPEAAEAGQDVIQELWLANPDQEPAVGLAGLAVGMSSVHDVKVSPDMLPYEILPGQVAEMVFTLHLPAELPGNVYFLKGMAVQDGLVNFANRPWQVLPARSREQSV